MAELLIVVAIIGILAAVGFIAVQSHQRSLAQLDRNTVAKEIFIAAQNHLAMADSQGLLGVDPASDTTSTSLGNSEYYTVNGDAAPVPGTMLELMLPFGAIDEMVRSNGSYLIHYQVKPAAVLDVFYCSTNDSQSNFNHTITAGEYNTFMGYRNNLPGSGYVVGWYGDEETVGTGEYLLNPTIEVKNEEKLTVEITNPNWDKTETTTLLLVTGVKSTAKTAISLNKALPDRRVTTEPDNNKYIVTLDDIVMLNDARATKNEWHFVNLNDIPVADKDYIALESGTKFIPGENIIIEAVAFNSNTLTNIAYSNQITTNSLFADLKEGEDGSVTAVIGNMRHLENLDASISGVSSALGITKAEQIVDLAWDDEDNNSSFVAKTKNGEAKTGVSRYGEEASTKSGCYLPVKLESALIYEGNGHSISNLVVDGTLKINESENKCATFTDGGLFSSATGCTIKNLELINTRVTLSSGSAGALAGKLEGCTVTNVIAYNTPDFEDALGELNGNKNSVLTVTTSGSAGGLIGSMTDSTVSKSAAALVVRGGNAGGLIGESSGGAVSASFSGGHTDKGTGSGTGRYSTSDFNVTGSSVAGGLIGAAGSTGIQGCYSTCSVKGAKAGGLVGSAEGNVSNCYATGLVNDPAEEKTDGEGAFAGEFTGSAGNCHYYMIINERPVDKSDAEKGFAYLPAVGGSETTGIAALDETAETYNEFVGSDWKSAVYYDKMLLNFYGKADGGKARFNLKTVSQLGQTLKESEADGTAYYVTDHYGDWPAPEIFVINTAG